MEYLCLRNCFVNDRYFTKGQVFDLPDEFPKYEKNFGSSGAEATIKCSVCGRFCKTAFGLKSHQRTHK